MSFTRTNSGLSNMAKFYGADLIVFTEGGTSSFTINEIKNGQYNKSSVDIKFWGGIFNRYGFDKKVHFRAVGSKTCSDDICDLLESGKIANIIVTRDSDLDDFLGGKVNSPFILYTHGYSWENDVWQPSIVRGQIESLIFTGALDERIINVIDSAYKNLKNNTFRLLKLELIYRSAGVKLITSMSGERFVSGRSVPKLKVDQILKAIRNEKGKLTRPIRINTKIDSEKSVRYCYGKLFEAFGLSLISYICKSSDGVRCTPKDVMVANMIDRFHHTKVRDCDQYYQSVFERLNSVL